MRWPTRMRSRSLFRRTAAPGAASSLLPGLVDALDTMPFWASTVGRGAAASGGGAGADQTPGLGVCRRGFQRAGQGRRSPPDQQLVQLAQGGRALVSVAHRDSDARLPHHAWSARSADPAAACAAHGGLTRGWLDGAANQPAPGSCGAVNPVSGPVRGLLRRLRPAWAAACFQRRTTRWKIRALESAAALARVGGKVFQRGVEQIDVHHAALAPKALSGLSSSSM